MSTYKEFQGKTLDEAIQEACDHFDMKRDKLEVEIVAGGSTGIFGLVGAKKAIVKARPRNAGNLQHDRTEKGRNEKARPERPRDEKPKAEAAPAPEQAEAPATREEAPAPAKREEAKTPAKREEAKTPAKRERAPRPRKAPKQEQPKQEQPPREAAEPDEDRQPRADSFADLDKNELEQTVREVTVTLIEQLVMAPKLEVKVGKDRVNVIIDEPEHSGLIIGREGQTLSSLQYLVNRIVSRRMETSVRVQIDTGDYRERQDEKLKQTADHLAEKAMKSGRTQSTKPLSSYHRRIVHLELQDDERVFTRSKGDGPMKRVLVVPKKRRGGHGGNGRDESGDVNGNR